ncbi:MAG: hypothetical protein H0V09_09590, partial [Gemmatimonadetes bacterium]|nr:hypothetical protein [Gemmatimonadota bacterium]
MSHSTAVPLKRLSRQPASAAAEPARTETEPASSPLLRVTDAAFRRVRTLLEREGRP